MPGKSSTAGRSAWVHSAGRLVGATVVLATGARVVVVVVGGAIAGGADVVVVVVSGGIATVVGFAGDVAVGPPTWDAPPHATATRERTPIMLMRRFMAVSCARTLPYNLSVRHTVLRPITDT
jgi:hypothetical protein